jgi:predicted Fe-Mo cluster-binding NifX family protein
MQIAFFIAVNLLIDTNHEASRGRPMKIAICTDGTRLSSLVAPLPESVASFIIYDPSQYSFAVLGNESAGAPDQLDNDGWVDILAEAGIDVLVVGGIALGIAHQLHRAGIRTYESVSETVWEAIQALKLNLLQTMNAESDGLDRWHALDD